MHTKTNYTDNSWRSFSRLLAALALALTVPVSAQTPPPTIPFPDIGARATAGYQGEALGVTATANGARLRCGFQKLEGRATPEGLWLESTKPGGGRLRLVAVAVGRSGSRARQCALTEAASSVRSGMSIVTVPQGDQAPLGAPCKHGAANFFDMPLLTELETTFSDVPFYRPAAPNGAIACLRQEAQTLARTGRVSVNEKLVRFTRPGLTEEYSVSVDGERQDFIIESPPLNPQRSTLNQSAGDLRLELALSGARAEAAADGARLRLDGSGRTLAYSRLRVEDATGRELTARLEVLSADRLAVGVADANATYPMRIDPTFSDADWVSLGVGMGGNNPCVSALAVSGTNLYAGGRFTTAGGVSANNIAKWDGSAWSALGSGMAGSYAYVRALAVSGTNLYAGGCFTTAGGVPANGIAKWDGSTWSALGSGISGGSDPDYVCALVVSGTNLYAGGSFAAVGGVPANGIAKWDGSTWSALGSGVSTYGGGGLGTVYALAVSGTHLYAGGVFTTAGGVAANYIAQWDGSAWSALGSGMNNTVAALALSWTNLYAGGWGGVAKWDGSTWSPLGSGLNYVTSLAVSETNLYAGGTFASDIAQWDGSAWSALGSGMNNYVQALAADGAGHLFVGGSFTLAGTNVSPYIAQANLGNAPTSAPPVIVASPVSLAVPVGATADFQVEAFGSPPLVYQWVFNGTTAIDGATSAVLSLTDVQSTQAGAYSVTVSNLYGAATSAPAVLTVTGVPPVIVASPAGLAVAGGATVDFQVEATGSPPLVYQWLFNGTTAIAGATSSVLSLANVQLTQAGAYSVTVSDLYGAVTSAPALLQVFPPGIVGSCTEACLRSAMAGGGTVTFACDGTITPASTITIAASTVLDASGHQVTISGGNAVRVFEVPANATLTLVNLTIANGTVYGGDDGPDAAGGAIYNSGTVIVDLCTFTGNLASGADGTEEGVFMGGRGMGGAVYNDSTGTLVVKRSTFSGNRVSGGAGAPVYPGWGGDGNGGAICNFGTLWLESSTLQNNGASGGAGGRGYDGHPWMDIATDGGEGGPGGVGAGGALYNLGSAIAVNSTFCQNSGSGGGGGAGGTGGTGMVANGNGGTGGTGGNGFGAVYDAVGGLHMTNCTLAFNWANGGGGGEGGAGGGSGTPNPGAPGPGGSSGAGVSGGINGGFIINTLLAMNGGNCSGSVTDGGHNLSSDGTCHFTGIGSLNNIDPKLGPLADNGGPTPTMALLPGSPAIDAGDNGAAPPTDQRGFPRPAGLAADIGAYEFGFVMPTVAISLSGATNLTILGSGNAGQSCRLLSSTDLLSWVPIATNQIGGEGTTQFSINCAPGSACQFYRLVMP
jgi:hypothetical protein